MGFYDNTLLITAVRGSRLLKLASDIIAVSPKLHVLALFFVRFIWHVYWHRNYGNFLVCHEGVIVGFDWGPPLSPCNGQLNTWINRWSSVCHSQRDFDFHATDRTRSLSVAPSGRNRRLGLLLHESRQMDGCRGHRTTISPFILHCLHVSLSRETAEMPLFCIQKVSHLNTRHCLCGCDCRFWLPAGSRSTTGPMCCSRTRTASSTRWSSRQAEPRPPRCCTQPNR